MQADTRELVAKLRGLLERATPGPWEASPCGSDVETRAPNLPVTRVHGYGSNYTFVCDLNDGEYHEYADGNEQLATAQLIVEMRNALPTLLALAERGMEAGWQTMESAPRRMPLVGYNAGFDNPYWIGELYDLNPRAIINWQTGRWRACTHWRPLPAPPSNDGERR